MDFGGILGALTGNNGNGQSGKKGGGLDLRGITGGVLGALDSGGSGGQKAEKKQDLDLGGILGALTGNNDGGQDAKTGKGVDLAGILGALGAGGGGGGKGDKKGGELDLQGIVDSVLGTLGCGVRNANKTQNIGLRATAEALCKGTDVSDAGFSLCGGLVKTTKSLSAF